MRSDENLPDSFRKDQRWITDPVTGSLKPEMERLAIQGPAYHFQSYSGHERNRFFLNHGGTAFSEVSLVAGLDNLADSRTWCWFDFNRDGALDIAMVNANEPLLNLYRNDIPARLAAAGQPARKFFRVTLAGAHHRAAPGGASNRDAIGAVITVTLPDGRRLWREFHCGEGYAAQNSRVIHFGIGKVDRCGPLEVRWPSGRRSRVEEVTAGALLNLTEPSAP